MAENKVRIALVDDDKEYLQQLSEYAQRASKEQGLRD